MGTLSNGKRGWGGLKNEYFQQIINDTGTLGYERLDIKTLLILITTDFHRQLVKNGELSMINTETESMEYYDIPWTDKFVYSYGICFEIVGSEFTRSLHYI